MSTRRGSPSAVPEFLGTGASPGFAFGRSGNVTAGAYLSNETVPSNLTGIPIELVNGRITGLVVRNQDSNTFDVEIEEHDGTTFTSLGIFSVTASRGDNFFSLDIEITIGKELAAKVSSGSAKNIKAILYVKGDAS